MGRIPVPVSGGIPAITLKTLTAYMDMGNRKENKRVEKTRVLAKVLPVNRHLPAIYAPPASHRTHEPIITPMESSLPEKRMSISLRRTIWAKIPPMPVIMMKKIRQKRFFILNG